MRKLSILTAVEKTTGEVILHGRKPPENLRMLNMTMPTVLWSGKDAYLRVKGLQMNYKMIITGGESQFSMRFGDLPSYTVSTYITGGQMQVPELLMQAALSLQPQFQRLAPLVTLRNHPTYSLAAWGVLFFHCCRHPRQEHSQILLVPCVDAHWTPVHPFRGTSIFQRALTMAQYVADLTRMTVPDSCFASIYEYPNGRKRMNSRRTMEFEFMDTH